jgi:4-hydroxybenzoate polyprenyltransferase
VTVTHGGDKDAALPDATLPDAVADHPLWRHAPESLRPYVQLARLDRPVG